jgi:hypothetical protein
VAAHLSTRIPDPIGRAFPLVASLDRGRAKRTGSESDNRET